MIAADPTMTLGDRAGVAAPAGRPRLRAGAPVDPAAFHAIRRRAILEGCKWDPQVGDVGVLTPFPLLLPRSEWQLLARLAGQLAAEAVAAEREILARPELLAGLGLPRRIRRILAGPGRASTAGPRIVRFDFHPTPAGWRISEANCDVPGGYTEASFFTRMLAAEHPGAQPAGDPAARLADALARVAGPGGCAALLSAPGFIEDHQVTSFLAGLLEARGVRTLLANPRQVSWREGRAFHGAGAAPGAIDLVVRFYQGEWLASLPAACGWRHFFRDGATPVTNPGTALVAETKRFPLVWDRLATRLPTWRALLPESRPPREAPWRRDDAWIVKAALSNTGDGVCLRELMPPREWSRLRWDVLFSPGDWVAQRRFESCPVQTPLGPMHTCIGVYTLDGEACGAYARLSPRAVVDYSAHDAAVLVEDDPPGDSPALS